MRRTADVVLRELAHIAENHLKIEIGVERAAADES